MHCEPGVADLSHEQLAFLASEAARDALAAELSDDPIKALTQLRKTLTAQEASAVLKMRSIRDRSRGRLGPLAENLLAGDVLAQQASSWAVACYKADLLSPVSAGRVWDLCCGAGVDAIALALRGHHVRAVDTSESAGLCLMHNAAQMGLVPRVEFLQAQAQQAPLEPGDAVHVDPDRRPGDRRQVDPRNYQPPLDFLAWVSRRTAAGLIKLSPGARPDDLPGLSDLHFRWVSENGVCKQLLAGWGGVFAGPAHGAVVLEQRNEDVTACELPAGQADPAEMRRQGAFVIEPDPAVTAAGAVDDLAAKLGASRRAVGLELLFSEAAVETPLARCYEVLEEAPGRLRDVRRALSGLDAGLVEVKPRGMKIDTDAFQARLRGKGRQTISIFWIRLGASVRAILCRRL